MSGSDAPVTTPLSVTRMMSDSVSLLPHSDRPKRPRIGLVLGAGGTWGCAHAGVIEVLREARIPIDLVVGASVGAIFGLGVAADVETEYLARVARDATAMQMARFYAGRLDLDRRNPISRMVRQAAGGRTFDQLPVPFAVSVTDVASGEPEVIDQGPVLPAVQASIALPMVSRPVAIAGRWYMDGGMFDTVPVGVARAMGAEVVVAVCLGVNYVAPRWLRRRPWTQPVFSRLGRQRRLPSDGTLDQMRFACRVAARSYAMSEPSGDADVAIWPEFGTVGPNSMGGGPFCYRQGIEAGRAALPRILAAIQPAGMAPVHD